MSNKSKIPLPEVFDPATIKEHGVTIPVPTPTGINIPNPWEPVVDVTSGGDASVASGAGENGEDSLSD